MYKRVTAGVPAGSILISIGSSGSQLAFMHELAGNAVAYVSFSRDMTDGDLQTETIFNTATKARVAGQLKKALAAAGVKPEDLRDTGKRFVLMDYIASGGSFVTFLEAFGELAPDMASRTTVLVLRDNNSRKRKCTLSRHGFTYKHVTVPTDFYVSGKLLARCVPKHWRKGEGALDAYDVAMCNLTRLWMASLA
jgi:hypothetical protein